jgi:hypothetical protein
MVLHIESSILRRDTARLEACTALPTSMSAGRIMRSSTRLRFGVLMSYLWGPEIGSDREFVKANPDQTVVLPALLRQQLNGSFAALSTV